MKFFTHNPKLIATNHETIIVRLWMKIFRARSARASDKDRLKLEETTGSHPWSFIILLILIIGFLFRFVNLESSPPGLNADEAALGYNAYSLLKTGKDEWGESFPIVFKSFSDYKPGLYVYLVIPFVAAFGLTETAVRLPSVLLGVLTIYLVYLLAYEIWRRKLYTLSASFLLAISPWHVHFSRGAWETNIATFFITLGVLGFVKGFKQGWWWIVSAISLVLAMYSYQSPRLIVPLLAVGLFLMYWKKLINKSIGIALIIAAIIAIPLSLTLFDDRGLARFEGVSIFSDIGPQLQTNVARGGHSDPESPLALLYHNKFIAYGINFTKHYLDHFSPNFLFISGDPLLRSAIPEMGQLYIFEIITVLLGLGAILSKNIIKYRKLLLVWVLTAPIAASLTYQTPHALRALSMVIPLTLISAIGLTRLIDYLNTRKIQLKVVGLVLTLFVMAFFVTRFLDLYFIHLPKQHGLEWQAGFKELVPFIMDEKDNYQKVLVTTRYDQPYILFLFYSKYDPSLYQNTSKTEADNGYGFTTVTQFENLEFRGVNQQDLLSPNTLVVGSKDDFAGVPNIVKQINFPNGEPAFRIIANP